MKDPAFLFYPADFLGGVSDLTMEERGQYITMLCLQQQKGVVSKKTTRLVFGNNLSSDVLAKFETDENGDYFNTRLRHEIAKRAQSSERQSERGKKGGAPKGNTNAKKTTRKQPLLENENRNENIDKDRVENIEGGTGGEAPGATTQRGTFEEFRVEYPGKKRSHNTEIAVLQKHSDWREVLPRLPAILEEQKRWREEARRHEAFVPGWPHLQTWLNQRRWEEELNFEFERAANNAAVMNDWISEDKLLAAGWRMIDIQNQFEYHPTTGQWRRKNKKQ